MTTKPAPNRTQEKKAASRERILKEAAGAIRLEGIDRVSVQGVMKRAGMTVGGFYAHFASKDDLVAHAIEYMFAERYARFLSDVDHKPAEETLGHLIDTYLSLRHRDGADLGCPIPPLAGEIGRVADPARLAFVAGMERLTNGIATLLKRLDLQEPVQLAGSILAEMAGTISLARVQPDRDKAGLMLLGSRQNVRARLGLDSSEAPN